MFLLRYREILNQTISKSESRKSPESGKLAIVTFNTRTELNEFPVGVDESPGDSVPISG